VIFAARLAVLALPMARLMLTLLRIAVAPLTTLRTALLLLARGAWRFRFDSGWRFEPFHDDSRDFAFDQLLDAFEQLDFFMIHQ